MGSQFHTMGETELSKHHVGGRADLTASTNTVKRKFSAPAGN